MKKIQTDIRKLNNGEVSLCEDTVAREAVYSLLVNGEETIKISCTPENLKELALGRMCTEGRIRSMVQVKNLQISHKENLIQAEIFENPEGGDALSCETGADTDLFSGDSSSSESVSPSELLGQAEAFFEQPGELFRETGCAHSCALWKNGRILCRFEDIGRHNALDKVVGAMLLQGISPDNCVIFTSGRISADYLAKIIHTGVKTVVSRAAVTSEAIVLAKKYGIAMYGFVRKGCGNLYGE